ncbi:MAG: PadR family transcriptional regulator [Pseudonocardiaceae bacterium]|nr:PadR family transcriptional regulator [Pseudonocardiaceae bacterium]
MSLRHALLALLENRPMTGYELAKQFDESAIYVWHAQHPQIYTELRKMEADGLIDVSAARRGTKATKRTYFLTEAGASELTRWVSEPQQPPRERDPAYLKAIYFEFGSFANARRQFEAHLEHYRRLERQWRAHADQLERRDTDLIRRRLARAPEKAHDAIVDFKVHTYRGLIERAKVEVAWAKRGLAMVDRLERDAGIAEGDEVSPPQIDSIESSE